jgi:tetratricopeptide (TPR) repeat protein
MKRTGAALRIAVLLALPVAAGAMELPEPDLGGLEPSVAQQLGELRSMAQGVLEAADSSAGDRLAAWGEMGRLFHAYRLLDAARQCYEAAETAAPEAADWPYYLGQVAVAEGDLEAAAAAFDRALALDSEDLATRVHAADVARDRGLLDEAREYLLAAERVAPHEPVVWARLGELALLRGEPGVAVERLEGALAAVPAATRLHHPLGLAYRALGDMEKARQHLEQRGDVGLAPPDPRMDELAALQVGERVHLLRGRQAYRAGRFGEAAEEFRLAVEAQPSSVRARINLGAALAGAGDTRGAMDELVRAVALGPDNATARFNLAALLSAAGKHSLAAAQYAEVLKRRPQDEQAWLGEAESWLALGDYRRAAARLSEAAEQLPESSAVGYALARVLVLAPDPAVRDGDRALDLALRVLEGRKDSNTVALVALALRELGRCADAAAWLDRWIAEADTGGAPDVVGYLKGERQAIRDPAACRP